MYSSRDSCLIDLNHTSPPSFAKASAMTHAVTPLPQEATTFDFAKLLPSNCFKSSFGLAGIQSVQESTGRLV